MFDANKGLNIYYMFKVSLGFFFFFSLIKKFSDYPCFSVVRSLPQLVVNREYKVFLKFEILFRI